MNFGVCYKLHLLFTVDGLLLGLACSFKASIKRVFFSWWIGNNVSSSYCSLCRCNSGLSHFTFRHSTRSCTRSTWPIRWFICPFTCISIYDYHLQASCCSKRLKSFFCFQFSSSWSNLKILGGFFVSLL